MQPLSILILSDGRPGHYHLAEGVAAAIARRRPVDITRVDVRRRPLAAGRMLASALRLGVSPAAVLRAGYRIAPPGIRPAELVISAGGETLAANVAASRLLAASNIFCGTLRHFPPRYFSLVISSYARHAGLPRHLVALKPSGLDPDTLPSRALAPKLGPDAPPRVAGLLVGGNSGLFKYRDDEWRHLADFLSRSQTTAGIRWIVSTSRRSPPFAADLLAELARQPDGPIAELIDFRSAGAGTLPRLLARAEAALVTEDSSSMLSEAVCARLPVVGVVPKTHDFKDEEREYRAFLTREGWIRTLPMADLTPASFLSALGVVRPLAVNHLDRLADALASRLPGLVPAPGSTAFALRSGRND